MVVSRGFKVPISWLYDKRIVDGFVNAACAGWTINTCILISDSNSG